MVHEPTRYGNILDLVLTSCPSLISETSTIAGMSDHEAVCFSLNLKPVKTGKPPHKVYNYKSADWDTLNSDSTALAGEYFQRNPDSLDLDTNWDFFHSKFTALIKKSIPSKQTKS